MLCVIVRVLWSVNIFLFMTYIGSVVSYNSGVLICKTALTNKPGENTESNR